MPQFFDPNELAAEVQELLRAHGLAPQTEDWPLAFEGACKLLRGMGITPALDPVEGLIRSVAEPWPDADDRRAAEIRS
jgi:hypothetical protein